MSKIDEQGNIQYCKVTLCDTLKAHVKAMILRFKNWDAERWYQKYGDNDSKH